MSLGYTGLDSEIGKEERVIKGVLMSRLFLRIVGV